MAVKLIQIEISQAIAEIGRPETGYEQVQALLRLHGEPLGWLMLDRAELPISGRAVAELIARDHTWPIYEHGLRKLLNDGPGLLPGAKLMAQTFSQLPAKRFHPMASALVLLNRQTQLPHLTDCLGALQKQDHPCYEVIVACTGALPGGAKELIEQAGAKLIAGENVFYRAVLEARGEFVSLTGSEAVPDTGWLRGVAEATDNPQVAGLVGPLFPYELETPGQLDFAARAKRPRWFTRYYNYGQVFELPPENFGTPLNASFRRRFLLEQCDEAFYRPEFGLKQMLQLYYQALKRDYMVGYELRALVWERYPTEQKTAVAWLKHEEEERAEYLAMAARHNPAYRKTLWQHFKASPATKRTAAKLALRTVQRRLVGTNARHG